MKFYMGKVIIRLGVFSILQPTIAQAVLADELPFQKFTTSPDQHLTLYRQLDCKPLQACQIYYQVDTGNIKKATVSYNFSPPPKVRWYGNMVRLEIDGLIDHTMAVFISAKQGVYSRMDVGDFDPQRQCLIAGLSHSRLAFFQLYDDTPRQILDLPKLGIDGNYFTPINGILVGTKSKFLDNGDFYFDSFSDKERKPFHMTIKNPCNL